MTGTYEWNPISHRVDVTCPACRCCAEFEFAEVVRIKLKTDVPFFQTSDSFEYQQFEDSLGHLWHAALFFEGLHGSPTKAIHDLPSGYSPQDWDHSRYLRSSRDSRVGSVRCGHCGMRARYTLNWPDDAYYAVAYRNHVLWAFHRESALELQEYLLSAKRDISPYRWSSFLLHVPTVFKTHKAREAVAMQLQRLLEPKGRSKRPAVSPFGLAAAGKPRFANRRQR